MLLPLWILYIKIHLLVKDGTPCEINYLKIAQLTTAYSIMLSTLVLLIGNIAWPFGPATLPALGFLLSKMFIF